MTTHSFDKRPIVLAIVYLLGTTVITVNTRAGQADSKESKPRQPSGSIEDEVKFTTILTGDGLTPGGARMYFTKYQSSRGGVLYQTWIDFSSPAQAAQELRGLTDHALKIIRKDPEIDKNGQQVGERILVLRRPEKAGEETLAILAWAAGASYQEIRSSSLQDVVAFEKQLRRSTK